MTHAISESREHIGGWGIPETVAEELAHIIDECFGGSMQKLADACRLKHSTVYAILVQGTGHSSLELIGKLAKGLGCTKNDVAHSLKKTTAENRKKELEKLCNKAGITLPLLSERCFGRASHIYAVINSNKRTQNFLKLVATLGLDVERFEEHYKKKNTAA